MSPEEELSFKVGLVTAVAFLAGLFMTVAGLLRFGFVTNFLSSSFVGGFTTAASFHILTSQVSKALNIKIKPYSGAGKIVKTYIDIFKNIDQTNGADIVIFAISIIFLLAVTIFINERYKSKLRVPVPVQLVAVIVSTIISHFAELHENFDVAIVGDVPKGLPSPSIPRMESLSRIATDAFVVAVLTFTISISLVKLTAKIHGCPVDDNQELLAYGLSNLLSSFFGCFTSCNAPPRAMILSNVGSRSTLNSVFCVIPVLIVLLAAGHLLHALPVAVLAAMICAAMKNLLLQVTQLPFLWRANKPDFIIWVTTALVSICADLDIGIIVGISVSILTVVVKSQLTPGSLGGSSVVEDMIHLNGNRQNLKGAENFKIFYFPSQLYFATAEKFKKELYSKVGDPSVIEMHFDCNENNDFTKVELDQKSEAKDKKEKSLKYIVLECSAMTYMDLSGADKLKTIANSYHKVGITLLLTNCPDYSLHVLEAIGYFDQISRDTVYYDIYDAVNFIQDMYSLSQNALVTIKL